MTETPKKEPPKKSESEEKPKPKKRLRIVDCSTFSAIAVERLYRRKGLKAFSA